MSVVLCRFSFVLRAFGEHDDFCLLVAVCDWEAGIIVVKLLRACGGCLGARRR